MAHSLPGRLRIEKCGQSEVSRGQSRCVWKTGNQVVLLASLWCPVESLCGPGGPPVRRLWRAGWQESRERWNRGFQGWPAGLFSKPGNETNGTRETAGLPTQERGLKKWAGRGRADSETESGTGIVKSKGELEGLRVANGGTGLKRRSWRDALKANTAGCRVEAVNLGTDAGRLISRQEAS